MRLNFYLLLTLLLCRTIYARTYGIIGGFSGVMVYNCKTSLNEILIKNSYGEAKSILFGPGVTGAIVINNIYIGGWGYMLPGEIMENGINRFYYTESFGTFNIGYVALNERNFVLIPKVGMGGCYKEIQVANSTINNADFSHLIENPGNLSIFKCNSISFEASLLTLLKLDFIHIGLSIGYIYSPQNQWAISGSGGYSVNAINSPPASVHNFYISTGIFLGAFTRNIQQEIQDKEDRKENGK